MKTILIVDPDSTTESLCELLNRNGYMTILIADAQTAIAMVRTGMPLDLVITELKLPDMDGIDFLGAIRKRRPALPVLVLTGSGSIESYLHAIHIGVLDYIHKPIRTKELGRIVTGVIDRHILCAPAEPPRAA